MTPSSDGRRCYFRVAEPARLRTFTFHALHPVRAEVLLLRPRRREACEGHAPNLLQHAEIRRTDTDSGSLISAPCGESLCGLPILCDLPKSRPVSGG
jgi:hypothetical protein